MKKNLALLLIVFLHSLTYGQSKLVGVVVDKNTKEPVVYANIGLLEKGIGTVSNTNGEFELLIPEDYKNSLIYFSHISYKDYSLNLSKIIDSNNIEISLTPEILELKEITIVSEKEIEFGHRPKGPVVAKGYFAAKGLGAEGGTFFKNENSVKLTRFNLNILSSTFDTLVFRLNFYSVKYKKPTEKINTSEIYFSVTQTDTGLFSVPIETANITVSNNFFCTIELVEIIGEKRDDDEFLFSAVPVKKGITVRKLISYDKWERFNGYSPCFWLYGKE